jgi:hybrid cluster-associated redox disulfide protein
MHCLGCPASRNESLEEACMVHGIPAEQVIDAINEKIAENK